MKVILLAGFGFDPLLNDDFSLQDQCIIQCKSDENWKRSSPTPKVSFFDESQNFHAELKGSVSQHEGRSNLNWQNLVVIVTLWAVSLANVKEVLYD